MLSKVILDTIGLLLKTGRKLRALPFEWDPKRQEVKKPKSKGFFLVWHLSILYVSLNTVFMGIRLAQAACCMGMSYGRLFMNLFNVVTYATGSGLLINTFIHLDGLVQLINHFMKTNQHFERVGTPVQGKVKGSSIRKIVYAIYTYSFAQFFIAWRQIDKNPKYLFTLTGIKVVKRWKVIPLALFECYMSYHVATVLLFYVAFIGAYVKSTAACLDVASKQNISSIPRNYRMLQAVNNEFNICCQAIILPFLLFCSGAVNILTDYASIRLYDDVSMPGFLGFPLAALASTLIMMETIPSSYRVYQRSQILIHSTREWTRPGGYVSKFLLSCQPLSIKVSQYFIIKQVTFMTFLGIVIDNAIMLLLSF